GSYRTLDPNAANPEFSATNFIEYEGFEIDRITQAAFSNDKLVIGDAGADVFYSVNLNDNSVEVYDSYALIEGGDIVFDQTNKPYMATKEGNGGLYVVYPDEVDYDEYIGDLPATVTGMALSSTNQLLISSAGASVFSVRELSGANNGESFEILLDGNAFQTSAGDMASGCNSSFDENEGDCVAFSTFYANHGPGISGTDLYSVTYSGTEAVLDLEINVNFQAHIAFNAVDNIVYLVNANGSEIVGFDPDNGIQGSVPINGSINSLFAVVYNPGDGLIYVGDDNDNEIYTIDPNSGDVEFYADGNVNGGDLALQGGNLYLANKSGSTLYQVIEGGANINVGNLPTNVNGMAQANNATGLVVSRANTDEFVEVNAADGSVVQTYNAILDGESFSLVNGDMAAGCADSDDDTACADGGECYPTFVDYVEGTTQFGAIAAERANPMNALGEPEGTDQLVFTTLGYGGSLTFEFDGVVPNGPGDDIEVVETSFNNPGCESFPEYADVSVSVDSTTFYYIGTVCKGDPFVDISDADVEIALECVSYVRVANNDTLTSTGDAFDVDGIVALHNCDDNGDDEEPALAGLEADNTLTSFPNPTSGLSQAVFITAATERATLEVYDMNGRVVETLFNQVANANQEYRVDFDGM
ncbi:MAG: hypothetical protein LC687_06775, partial [Actinobacteria bacterium]|nr:hypothetical protein [Actinomycetota bacterium]